MEVFFLVKIIENILKPPKRKTKSHEHIQSLSWPKSYSFSKDSFNFYHELILDGIQYDHRAASSLLFLFIKIHGLTLYYLVLVISDNIRSFIIFLTCDAQLLHFRQLLNDI